MPVITDKTENWVCNVCGEHKPVLRVRFIDQRGILENSIWIFLCESCYKEVLIYDSVIHRQDGFGVKFGDIRERYGFLKFDEIKEIVGKSSWGKVEKMSNKSKVVKVNDWELFEKMEV